MGLGPAGPNRNFKNNLNNMHIVNDLTNYIIGDGSLIEQPKHTAPGSVSQTIAKNTGLMKQQIMTEGSVFDKIDSRSLISPQRT